MSPNLRRLNTAALTCLLLALSPATGAQVPAAAEKIQVSQATPLNEQDPLQRWFKEQDRLLDDILVRLSRIENLVRELHRLISQMPGPSLGVTAPAVTQPAAVAQPAMAPVAAPAPPPKPAMPAPAGPVVEPAGDLMEHAPLLGGALLVALLLGMWLRHRSAAKTYSAPIMVEPAPAPEQPASSALPKSATPKPQTAPAPARQEPVSQSPSLSLPVAQNDQAMELAEIMLSMGLGHGAANTLVEQIRREPKQALMHWLKLLEIYRQNGQQAEFEKSAEELRLHFNVQPEDWNVQPGSQRSLEDYPHIAARIVELWGKPSCLAYLQNLLDDNRGGARSGFPQSVAEELLILSAMLKGSP